MIRGVDLGILLLGCFIRLFLFGSVVFSYGFSSAVLGGNLFGSILCIVTMSNVPVFLAGIVNF